MRAGQAALPLDDPFDPDVVLPEVLAAAVLEPPFPLLPEEDEEEVDGDSLEPALSPDFAAVSPELRLPSLRLSLR